MELFNKYMEYGSLLNEVGDVIVEISNTFNEEKTVGSSCLYNKSLNFANKLKNLVKKLKEMQPPQAINKQHKKMVRMFIEYKDLMDLQTGSIASLSENKTNMIIDKHARISKEILKVSNKISEIAERELIKH